MPTPLSPMMAVPGALPRNDTGWAFEMKWDGVRGLAFIDGGQVRLASRTGRDITVAVAAIELAPYEILVNCISPGLIDTQPKPLVPVMAERLASRIPHLPLARPGDPNEVASLALWLCSSGSTGQQRL